MNSSASRPSTIIGAVVATSLLLASATSSAAADQSGTVILVQPFAPKAGFALETDDAQILTKAGCLEMLTRIDFDGTLKPGLATSWVQSSPTSWDFTLRPNTKFADGTSVDAAAVVTVLTHTLHAAAPARAFSPKVVSDVTAVDDRTVRVTTPGPSVLVPLRMASPNTGILSPAALTGTAVNPVKACTGPFTVTEEVPRQLLRLERNANYWGGPVGFARAEVRYVSDGEVRGIMVQTGEAQIAIVLPVAVLRTPPPAVHVVTTPLPRTTAMYLNDGKPPFDDLRVRQALQAAIDTTAIASSIYEGLAQPAVGPFANGEPWSSEGAQPVTLDVKKAKDLLAAAGIKPNTLTMDLWAYPERPELADLASVLQAELGDIGVTVKIKVASYSALEPDLLAGNFGGMLLSRSHLTDVPDPGAFIASDYTCKGSYNISHFCQPDIDAALEQAVAFPEADRRFKVYAEVAAKLQSEAVSVFLVHEQERDAFAATVANFRTHPLGHYVLTKDLAPAK